MIDYKPTSTGKIPYEKEMENQKTIFLEDREENQIRALSLSLSDQIDLVVLDLRPEDTIRKVQSSYRTFGSITDFCLHPSKEYLFVLSKNGLLYIFNVEDGDIRAKI